LFFPNLAPKDHDAAAEDAALRAGTLDAAKPSVCPFRGLHPASGSFVPLPVAQHGKPIGVSDSEKKDTDLSRFGLKRKWLL
jgi:hypothetical protein